MDKAAFIKANLTLLPVEGLPGIAVYTAHPRSRLARLGDVPPYWAYVWAGGAALARYVAETDVARGLRVLDFGAGSGVVGIAAARVGAAAVMAVEPDEWARAAVGVNAAANGVVVGFDPGAVDLVLAGDVFYNPQVAVGVMPVLDGFLARGVRVLVGDPGRVDLPLGRLSLLAEYAVRDMGDGPGRVTMARVYDYRL